jgi:hypothetical protein
LSVTALSVPAVVNNVTVPCELDRLLPPASFTRTVMVAVDVPSASSSEALELMVEVVSETVPTRPAPNWNAELVADASPGEVKVSV